ncbi:putative Sec18p [Mycena filopes]|nr:putative Sec18p [Mycena filopes]
MPLPPNTRFKMEPSPYPLALTNRLVVHPSDFRNGEHVLCEGQFHLTVIHDDTGKVNRGSIAANGVQRQWIGQPSAGNTFSIVRITAQPHHLQTLELEVRPVPLSGHKEILDSSDLAPAFFKIFNSTVLAVDELLIFELGGQSLVLTVKTDGFGVVNDKTVLTFRASAESRGLIIKPRPGEAATTSSLINYDFKDSIGGLDEQLSIVRDIFISRDRPEAAKKLGMKHKKGLILYGPPGTGKTLIAREIASRLTRIKPKIINGPEMQGGYAGAAETRVRALFSEAENEYQKKKDKSQLHVIIFDEFDALFRERTTSDRDLGNSIVAQLLAKMDGNSDGTGSNFDPPDNFLVIGMTNRLEAIDQAFRRPGRFDTEIKIPLPDETGRLQIFKIHTRTMSANHLMGPDVDLKRLAAETANFSGADIKGLVDSASGRAMKRCEVNGVYDDKIRPIVRQEEFLGALDEHKPRVMARARR